LYRTRNDDFRRTHKCLEQKRQNKFTRRERERNREREREREKQRDRETEREKERRLQNVADTQGGKQAESV
jgi:hypothetical protein